MSDLKEDEIVDVALPKEEPVTVVLDGEAPKVEKKDDEPAPKVEDKSAEMEAALADLRTKLDQERANAQRERQAREQAEQFAQEQSSKVRTAEVEVQDSNLRTIVNAINAVEQTAKNAARTYADAMTAGDYDAAATAQRSISRAEAQLLQLTNGKNALEERLQSRQAEGRVTDDGPKFQQNLDPVERLAQSLAPASAAWLRAHPDAAQSVDKLTAAHAAAVNLRGIQVESPEYFTYIEQELYGEKKPDAPKTEDKPRKQPIPSAPTSSGSGGGRSGDGGNQMTLSAAEVEMAVLAEPGLTRDKALEVYARNKRALQLEGKLR
jgi:hypothetical protein